MTNEEIYDLADSLGMVEECEEKQCCSSEDHYETAADKFAHCTQDLVYVMNFVSNLLTYNDQPTVERFLTALIYNNHA